MFKRFIPFAHAQSIYEIPADFYLNNGVNLLLIDLDNTLDSYRLFEPTERAVKLIESIKKTGILPVIVSNNKEKRVKKYADMAGVECIYSAHKPFSRRLRKFLKEKGVQETEVMLVGDQLMTDVLAARGAHIRVLLTEKIVKEDQWTTRFNSIFGRFTCECSIPSGTTNIDIGTTPTIASGQAANAALRITATETQTAGWTSGTKTGTFDIPIYIEDFHA